MEYLFKGTGVLDLERECSGDLFHSNMGLLIILSFVFDGEERGREEEKEKNRNTFLREFYIPRAYALSNGLHD